MVLGDISLQKLLTEGKQAAKIRFIGHLADRNFAAKQ
jgi:hypothetical protein